MQRILAADIGGTNSRFAVFEAGPEGSLGKGRSIWLSTQDAKSLADLIDRLNQEGFDRPLEEVDMAVFAVAGPVVDGVYSNPPNIAWDIDLSAPGGTSALKRCELINDFAAQAYACRSPVIEEARRVISGETDPEAPLIVVGAGTGLGHAALINDRCGRWLALASEGGHAGFAFETEAENDYKAFVLQQTGLPYVEAETVLSGRGLVLIHYYLTGQKLRPSQISEQIGDDDPTVQWMARFFGRVCRNFALQLLAYGGVYIAGGIAAKLPQLVTHPEFEAAFRRSATMADELKKIPVFLNANEESGLWGAAFFGRQQLDGARTGVSPGTA